jgi:hypothetical protein
MISGETGGTDSPEGPLAFAENQSFEIEFFLSFGISRKTKKCLLCVLCGSVVSTDISSLSLIN